MYIWVQADFGLGMSSPLAPSMYAFIRLCLFWLGCLGQVLETQAQDDRAWANREAKIAGMIKLRKQREKLLQQGLCMQALCMSRLLPEESHSTPTNHL